MKRLLLALLGKRPPRTRKKDVLDILFEQPEMTLKQADWLINGRKRVFTWILFLLIAIAAAARWYFL